MKKTGFVIYFLIAGFSTMAGVKSINEKLVRNFRETYPNAVQVNWKEYPDTYAVNFAEGGVRSTIIYYKDGSFVRSTRYYKEENLPYYLVVAVREKYPLKKIYCVTETATPYSISYYIKLEDTKTWMTIKADSDGNMKLVEKFNKA